MRKLGFILGLAVLLSSLAVIYRSHSARAEGCSGTNSCQGGIGGPTGPGCGGSGQRCCYQNTCGSHLFCESGTCRPPVYHWYHISCDGVDATEDVYDTPQTIDEDAYTYCFPRHAEVSQY